MRTAPDGGRGQWAFARVLTGLLGMFSIVAILSLGMFVVPVVLLLALAIGLTPEGSGQTPQNSALASQPSVSCW